jgi:putative ABC transport system permease protein
MIIGTLVVMKQLNYFRNTDLGFNKENLLIISNTSRLGNSEESFREAITQVPGVLDASIASSIPSGSLFGDSYQPQPENAQTTKEINLNSFMVDENYIPALGIHVIKGRNFSKQFTDSPSVILNEEAVKLIGWKDPIGKWLDYPGGDNTRFTVVGVVKNFNVQSLQNPMVAFGLFHISSKTYDRGSSYIVARLQSNDLNRSLNQLESKWKSFVSAEPFDFNFLDAAFDAQYRSEQRLGSIFRIFAVLSIFIACLGLFGLSVFMAEKRIKEIGIRKVLGASVTNVVALMSKDFLKLTIIAAVIAFPVAWYFMNKWLEDFPYRINIGWSLFLVAGVCMILITVITISFESIRAALSNPVKNLRTE